MNRHFDSLVTQLSTLRHTPHEGPSGNIIVNNAGVGDNEDDDETDA